MIRTNIHRDPLSTLLRLAVAVGCLFLISAAGEKTDKRLLSVLVIDGINNHDWETGTRAVKAILNRTGQFTVEVSTTPPKGAPKKAWDSWRPQLSKYNADLVIFNAAHTYHSIL